MPGDQGISRVSPTYAQRSERLVGGLWGLWKTDKRLAVVGAGDCHSHPSSLQNSRGPLAGGMFGGGGLGHPPKPSVHSAAPSSPWAQGGWASKDVRAGVCSCLHPSSLQAGPGAQMVSAATPHEHTCVPTPPTPWLPHPCSWALQLTPDVVEGRKRHAAAWPPAYCWRCPGGRPPHPAPRTHREGGDRGLGKEKLRSGTVHLILVPGTSSRLTHHKQDDQNVGQTAC